jgi:hypothetical protein
MFLALGLFPLALGILVAVLTWWLLYLAIRNGVREGMSAARIRWPSSGQVSTPAPGPGTAPPGFRWVLVPEDAMPYTAQPMDDMRAD